MRNSKSKLFSTLKNANKPKKLSKEDREALDVGTRGAYRYRSNDEILRLLINLGKAIKKGTTIDAFSEANGIHPSRLRVYRSEFRKNPNKYLKGQK